nr:hypothetical protein [Tanacetum cinerariifolium]
MAEIKMETTMDGFVTKDRTYCYLGIARITVNGKYAVEHIDYFLKIVDPIKLPNVNYERIRLAIFPISLVGNASKWFDEFKESRAQMYSLKAVNDWKAMID